MAHGKRPLLLLVAMGSRRRCSAVRFVARTKPRQTHLMGKRGVFIGGFGRPPSPPRPAATR
jgi:hypothetical protein